jgi:hypothetical protein
MIVNGREYPLWTEFVERKEQFIGGVLEDFGDPMDRRIFPDRFPMRTTITDITLKPNGTDSAFFEVVGADWGCGFDAEVGGVSAGEKGWITFTGYMGHKWRIKAAY